LHDLFQIENLITKISNDEIMYNFRNKNKSYDNTIYL
jgi:hypothetical protein